MRHSMAFRVSAWGKTAGAALCLAVASTTGVAWGVPPCPAPATLTVFAENLAADSALSLAVAGELRDPAATCAGPGDLAYATTLQCTGTGTVRCGTIANLHPGTWINRVTVTVAGSAPQVQARQTVLLGGTASSISNVLAWTVYPRSFVVATPTEANLRQTLDAAATFTATTGGSALVTFDRGAFPGAGAPVTIPLAQTTCAADQRHAALCLDGSRLVVDALDPRGERGAVVLSAGSHPTALLRVYGADDVLRGLVLEGSTDVALTTQADTVAFAGAAARRNRLEHCLVLGPTKGDAVSAGADSGQPAGVTSGDNVVDDCELTGARDKGVKVTTGGHVTIRASCVHDNENGGLQATLGGALTAIDNVVQHNIPGGSQSGIGGGATGDLGARNTLITRGNIVRFSGARGMTVVDATDASFADDYVADNQFSGARIETTTGATAPTATFNGVAFVCNHNGGITGTCRSSTSEDGALCTTDADCCEAPGSCCATDPGCASPARCAPTAPQGFGAVVAACAGCPAPEIEFGRLGEPGGNAFALNVNTYPNALGVNLLHEAAGRLVAAEGNQWEHCGGAATCDLAAVLSADVELGTGAQVAVDPAQAPRADVPVPVSASIARPRAGDLVRVFGRNFNAIDGAACAQATEPVAPCSAENPRVALLNRSGRFGNRVVIGIGGETVSVDIDAVTPTMIAFRMPFDCFAPATLQVSKRDPTEIRHGETMAFCDAGGCLDRAAGAPCDDRSACTVGDACTADGRCVPGTPLDCGGPCMQCDPAAGCVARATGAPCTDADACTVGDHCPGDGPACVPGVRAECDDDDLCTAESCDFGGGCLHQALTDFDAVTCRFDRNTTAIARTLGTEIRLAKMIGRTYVQLDTKMEIARAAHAEATVRAARKARRNVDAVIRRLTSMMKRLPHRRVLPPAFADVLTSNIGEALDAAVQLRTTL